MIMFEDFIREERITAVANYFGLSKAAAAEAIDNCGSEIEEIRTYLESKGEDLKGRLPKCICCGKKLTDPISIKRGYGEDCFRKVQLNLFSGVFEEFTKKDVES